MTSIRPTDTSILNMLDALEGINEQLEIQAFEKELKMTADQKASRDREIATALQRIERDRQVEQEDALAKKADSEEVQEYLKMSLIKMAQALNRGIESHVWHALEDLARWFAVGVIDLVELLDRITDKGAKLEVVGGVFPDQSAFPDVAQAFLNCAKSIDPSEACRLFEDAFLQLCSFLAVTYSSRVARLLRGRIQVARSKIQTFMQDPDTQTNPDLLSQLNVRYNSHDFSSISVNSGVTFAPYAVKNAFEAVRTSWCHVTVDDYGKIVQKQVAAAVVLAKHMDHYESGARQIKGTGSGPNFTFRTYTGTHSTAEHLVNVNLAQALGEVNTSGQRKRVRSGDDSERDEAKRHKSATTRKRSLVESLAGVKDKAMRPTNNVGEDSDSENEGSTAVKSHKHGSASGSHRALVFTHGLARKDVAHGRRLHIPAHLASTGASKRAADMHIRRI